ncbi:hypothetical protein BpHYR1_047761 [Brachionus plicatilis]|uniref:Uncharacterized protein n=1 Tax=Brachionus plicatilis TaxID=10195 RepID=A0A3M7T879_BRAPC|nr:hypothetical protein BpHYR1_047761 [Brachionus plicatilis]
MEQNRYHLENFFCRFLIFKKIRIISCMDRSFKGILSDSKIDSKSEIRIKLTSRENSNRILAYIELKLKFKIDFEMTTTSQALDCSKYLARYFSKILNGFKDKPNYFLYKLNNEYWSDSIENSKIFARKIEIYLKSEILNNRNQIRISVKYEKFSKCEYSILHPFARSFSILVFLQLNCEHINYISND